MTNTQKLDTCSDLENKNVNLKASVNSKGIVTFAPLQDIQKWNIQFLLADATVSSVQHQTPEIIAVQHDRSICELVENIEGGIEHSFAIAHGPSSPFSLRLSVQTEGIKKIGECDSNLCFWDQDEEPVFVYHNLIVRDATGRQIKSNMYLEDGPHIILDVVEPPVYPVLIDPLATIPGKAFLPFKLPNLSLLGSGAKIVDISCSSTIAHFAEDSDDEAPAPKKQTSDLDDSFVIVGKKKDPKKIEQFESVVSAPTQALTARDLKDSDSSSCSSDSDGEHAVPRVRKSRKQKTDAHPEAKGEGEKEKKEKEEKEKKEKEEKEKKEKEEKEKEKLREHEEKERREREKEERERVEKDKAEQEKERVKKAEIEREEAEKEKEKAEKARADKEKDEHAQKEKERVEQLQRDQEKERVEKQKADKEKEEQVQKEKERVEKERQEHEKAEKEKEEKDRAEKEKERVKQEQEKADKDKAEKDKAEKEAEKEKERIQQERENAEKDKAEREKERIKQEQDKAEKDKAEKEKAEKEKERIKQEQEKAEKDKQDKEAAEKAKEKLKQEEEKAKKAEKDKQEKAKPPRPITVYKVTINTSDVFGAGTDATVFVHLFGELGDSGERRIETMGEDLFERGDSDVVFLEAPNLGELQRLRVRHDDSGFGAGWHLDSIIVTDEKAGKKWVFKCGRWLDKKEDDGKIDRELFAIKNPASAKIPKPDMKKEKAAREKFEKEKKEAEKEKPAKEKEDAAKAEKDRQAKEKEANEKAEKEKKEKEEKEKAEKEKKEKEDKEKAQKAEKEKKDKEDKDQAEKEKKEREDKEKAEKVAKQKAEEAKGKVKEKAQQIPASVASIPASTSTEKKQGPETKGAQKQVEEKKQEAEKKAETGKKEPKKEHAEEKKPEAAKEASKEKKPEIEKKEPKKEHTEEKKSEAPKETIAEKKQETEKKEPEKELTKKPEAQKEIVDEKKQEKEKKVETPKEPAKDVRTLGPLPSAAFFRGFRDALYGKVELENFAQNAASNSLYSATTNLTFSLSAHDGVLRIGPARGDAWHVRVIPTELAWDNTRARLYAGNTFVAVRNVGVEIGAQVREDVSSQFFVLANSRPLVLRFETSGVGEIKYTEKDGETLFSDISGKPLFIYSTPVLHARSKSKKVKSKTTWDSDKKELRIEAQGHTDSIGIVCAICTKCITLPPDDILYSLPDGSFIVVHPKVNFVGQASAAGITYRSLTPEINPWTITLSLQGAKVNKAYAQSQCTVVLLRDKGIREYLSYADRSADYVGLHHSFHLHNPPVSYPLRIQIGLAFDNITQVEQDSESHITFSTERGAVFEYGNLAVLDARGKSINSKILLEGTEGSPVIVIEVLEEGEFPLVIG